MRCQSSHLAPLLAILSVLGSNALVNPQPLMPLADLEQRLNATPPTVEHTEARLALFKELDRWALAEDTIYWDGNPLTANPDWLAFYLRRVDKALREIRETTVTTGVVLWKLYSSGFVVKSPQATFALDVVEGPFKDIHKSPDEVPAYPFKWSPAQRLQYAELVDAHFITHWHYDHASFALARELVRNGKLVVVPQQLKDAWQKHGFADRLTVLAPDVNHTLGRLTVRTFEGVQYMKQDEAGNWISGRHDAQNNIYWISTGQLALLQNGDNRGPDWYGWLEKLKADGLRVDLWLSILGFPRDSMQRVTQIHDPFVIPGHEHEVGHKPTPGGVTLLEGKYHGIKHRLAAGKAMQLCWGERFAIGDD